MRQRLPGLLLAGGGALWLVAVLSDPLGVGGSSVYGWKQVTLAEVGLALIFAGLAVQKRREQVQSSAPSRVAGPRSSPGSGTP